VARARHPRGVIYAAGKPRYRIEAATGIVLNDGELIQLEGAVKIRVVGSQPATITGDRVRWTPKRDLIEIDRRPMATDRNSRLTATTARFLLDKDKLELRGTTRLVQSDLNVTVRQADWFPSSGRLLGEGPVLGQRLQPAGKVQTLTASALEANTRQEVLEVMAPVRFVDPAQKTVIDAQRSRWDVKQKLLTTDLPFEGTVDQLNVRGQSLIVRMGEKTAFIPSGCDVRQPGEHLVARECRWNWETQAIEAQGSVQLNRAANDQITRSERLTGRVGDKGLAEFTTPGGRVHSRLRVPPPSDRPRKPAPVTF
jgi:lipopolysaccharide export system protein LptC